MLLKEVVWLQSWLMHFVPSVDPPLLYLSGEMDWGIQLDKQKANKKVIFNVCQRIYSWVARVLGDHWSPGRKVMLLRVPLWWSVQCWEQGLERVVGMRAQCTAKPSVFTGFLFFHVWGAIDQHLETMSLSIVCLNCLWLLRAALLVIW